MQLAAVSVSPVGRRQSVSLVPRWAAAVLVLWLAFLFCFYGLADHPPGIWFDPAFNGLDALRIMQRGGPVLFFPTNGGREALFIYLLIPSIWAFGPTPFSLRLVTALMGVLQVALVFGFLVDLPSLLPPDQPLVRQMKRWRLWLALIGGLVLATSYWHLVVSHRAQRPLMVSLFSVPLFWFFLKGWRSGNLRWYALSGLMLGLEAYTYGAGRVLPVILAITLLPELLRGLVSSLRRRSAPGSSGVTTAAAVGRTGPGTAAMWAGIGLLLLVACLVCLPMAWYFLAHQAQFSARAGSVMIWHYVDGPAQVAVEAGRNLLRVLGYFCCTGSPSLSAGLPDTPGLSPLLTPFLAIGVFGAFVYQRQMVHRLVFWWWLIGILPSVIAIEAPHQLRMIAAVVPTAIFVALAVPYVGHWLQRWHAPSRIASLLPWLVVALTLASAPFTWRAYFVEWANLKATREHNDDAAIAIRDAVSAQAVQGTPVYLPMSRLNDSPLLYYLGGAFERQAALEAETTGVDSAFVVAPSRDQGDETWVRFEGDTATILPPLDSQGLAVIRAGLDSASAVPVLAPGGERAGWLARLETDPGHATQRPSRSLAVSFGPMRLTGISYPDTIDPASADRSISVTCYWQANTPMRDEYEVLLHVVDDRRTAWGNGDARPTGWIYPTSFWRPGLDTVAAQHEVRLDEGASPPPGRYWLAVSVYDPATGRRLPLTEGVQGDSPDTYLAGPLKVPLPPVAEELRQRAVTQEATFGETVTLVGVVPEQMTVHAGEEVRLTLLWQALSTPAADYTVFVHLLDSEGKSVAGGDSQPVANTYPTSIWSPGEIIADTRTVTLAGGDGEAVRPGRYRVSVGMYDWQTGQRLPVHLPDGSSLASGELMLDQVVRVEP